MGTFFIQVFKYPFEGEVVEISSYEMEQHSKTIMSSVVFNGVYSEQMWPHISNMLPSALLCLVMNLKEDTASLASHYSHFIGQH